MHIKQFHDLPKENYWRNEVLNDLAKKAVIPVPLQRPKNSLKSVKGIGDVTAKQIIQALCMWMVENNVKL